MRCVSQLAIWHINFLNLLFAAFCHPLSKFTFLLLFNRNYELPFFSLLVKWLRPNSFNRQTQQWTHQPYPVSLSSLGVQYLLYLRLPHPYPFLSLPLVFDKSFCQWCISLDPATYVHKICCAFKFLIGVCLIVAVTYLTNHIQVQSVYVKEEKKQVTWGLQLIFLYAFLSVVLQNHARRTTSTLTTSSQQLEKQVLPAALI
jgi:hypothetical protein